MLFCRFHDNIPNWTLMYDAGWWWWWWGGGGCRGKGMGGRIVGTVRALLDYVEVGHLEGPHELAFRLFLILAP